MKAPLYWMLFNAQLAQLQNLSFFTNFPQTIPTNREKSKIAGNSYFDLKSNVGLLRVPFS